MVVWYARAHTHTHKYTGLVAVTQSATMPANIMRVKEAVIDEEELIKQERRREKESERLINQHSTHSHTLTPTQSSSSDVYLEAHYGVLLKTQ